MAGRVAELRSRGVTFEEYDLPDWKTVDGIAPVPELGRAAYFKDSEGNLLGDDPVRVVGARRGAPSGQRDRFGH